MAPPALAVCRCRDRRRPLETGLLLLLLILMLLLLLLLPLLLFVGGKRDGNTTDAAAARTAELGAGRRIMTKDDMMIDDYMCV